MLSRLTGVSLSARSAARLCSKQAAEQAQQFAKERQEASLPLAFETPNALPKHLPPPDVLYIAADGIQTPMKGGRWKEMKVGVVQSRHADGRVEQESRYVSVLGDSATFGVAWEARAISCGSLFARRVVVLGDGAAWLWNLAQQRFPRAVQILDFWHALEYVGKVAREAFGEGSEAAKVWLSARAAEMKQSAWSSFTAALEAVRSRAPESFTETVRYFANNAARMDYARYLRMGLSIGSGIAESSCKRLVTQRLKGSGMHWSPQGAQAICSLRALLLGGEWETFTDFWRRQVQARPLSPLS
jgi:hypothetical protein